jgi:hypothetical protein
MALASCGGGNSPTTSQVTASPETSSGFETGPLKVVGGGSSSYRIPGHHTAVPGYGREVGGGNLKSAATDAHGYLVAGVEKDWPGACSYASQELVRRLAARRPAGAGCAAILAALTVPGPGGSDYESSEVEAESLRAKGNRGFLLYRAAAAPYYLPMLKEGSVWKVNALSPTPFY